MAHHIAKLVPKTTYVSIDLIYLTKRTWEKHIKKDRGNMENSKDSQWTESHVFYCSLYITLFLYNQVKDHIMLKLNLN